MNPIISVILKRLFFGFLSLFVITVLIFVGVEALPGDLAEAILGQQATPETLAAFRKELKLDLPPHIRYGKWIADIVQLDLGRSLTNGREVSELVGWRLKNTLFLAVATSVICVPLAIVLGLMSALYRNSFFDRFISFSTLSAISFPEFFVAYILIALFSVKFHFFPSIVKLSEDTSIWHKLFEIALPCATLILVVLAHMMRMTRAAIINVLSSPFIEMAQLKGFKLSRIIIRHALPNALSPIINAVVLNLAWLVTGVVVVEVVFAFPGLGQLMVDAVSKRDLPVVQVCGLIFAATYVLMNLLADILSQITNPRLLHPKN